MAIVKIKVNRIGVEFETKPDQALDPARPPALRETEDMTPPSRGVPQAVLNCVVQKFSKREVSRCFHF